MTAVRCRVDVLLDAVGQRVVDRVDRSRRTGEVDEAGREVDLAFDPLGEVVVVEVLRCGADLLRFKE